jgi:hypothetical protein
MSPLHYSKLLLCFGFALVSNCRDMLTPQTTGMSDFQKMVHVWREEMSAFHLPVQICQSVQPGCQLLIMQLPTAPFSACVSAGGEGDIYLVQSLA